MAYVGKPKEAGCLFCNCLAAPPEEDRAGLVLLRGTCAFVMLNRYPYTNGHLMIAPSAHVPSFEDLDGETNGELMELLQRSLAALRLALRPEGFNVGANLGLVAGAGMADHVHLHVVPRWLGDTNFMPVLADTRLIPQLLEESYDALQRAGLRSPQ